MKLNRIAIVGLGSIGKRHLRLIKEIRPNIKVTLIRSGVGPSSPEENMAERVVFSIEEALKHDIDAAIISSPAPFHVSQAIILLKSGVHLLIEKPLSDRLDDLDNLVQVASKSNTKVMVGYVLRHDPAAIEFKKIIESDEIGDSMHISIECGSYLPDWRPGQDYKKTVSALSNLGGGVLLELSHELDYFHWFFGKPAFVFSRLKNSKTLEVDVEDQADMLFTTNSDIPVVMQIDFNRRHPLRICTLQTTKGELIWNAGVKSVEWKPSSGEAKKEIFDFNRDYIYKKQLEHFIDCVEKNTQPKVTLNDGVVVMKMIDSIRKSNLEQRIVAF